MDNSYSYIPSYEHSFEYSSPSSSSYYYPATLPSCPLHSSHMFYTSPVPTYSFYEQPTQMISPLTPSVNPVTYKPMDHTPLRRHRCFKKNELQILHQSFSRDSHPTIDVLQQLADQLKAPVEKVRQWFKNRRHSEKQKNRASARST